jgi:hypothetical protein
MWFISFVLGAATAISIGVFGWSSYLEYAKAGAAEARQREWLASMPMPPPRPHVPEPKPRVAKVDSDVEVVRVPTPAKVNWKTYRKQQRYVSRKPKQTRVRETW